MEILDPDTVSRTWLLRMRSGQATSLEAAAVEHAQTAIVLYADSSIVSDRAGQAALLTAATTGVRAFGTVTVVLEQDAVVLAGTFRGRGIVEAIAAEGAAATFEPGDVDAKAPAVVLGLSAAPTIAHVHALRAGWDGWVALVGPADDLTGTDDGNVLAATAAGALAIDELFNIMYVDDAADAGERIRRLDLWSMDDTGADTAAPAMTWAPHGWWLVGLGHLGQAYAWVISQLPYENPAQIPIVLQDIGRTSIANHSTGVLTPADSVGIRKTRQAAAALEAAGLTETVIVERRLDADTTLTATESTYVALLGIDDVDGRKLISGIGWRYAVDAGLGTTVGDFDSISIHTFPGYETSAHVGSWNAPAPKAAIPDVPAFNTLAKRYDQCGVLELAGKAVGASFVGVLTAVLAIAEPIRALHGGTTPDRFRYDARSDDLTVATSLSAPDVFPANLDVNA